MTLFSSSSFFLSSRDRKRKIYRRSALSGKGEDFSSSAGLITLRLLPSRPPKKEERKGKRRITLTPHFRRCAEERGRINFSISPQTTKKAEKSLFPSSFPPSSQSQQSFLLLYFIFFAAAPRCRENELSGKIVFSFLPFKPPPAPQGETEGNPLLPTAERECLANLSPALLPSHPKKKPPPTPFFFSLRLFVCGGGKEAASGKSLACFSSSFMCLWDELPPSLPSSLPPHFEARVKSSFSSPSLSTADGCEKEGQMDSRARKNKKFVFVFLLLLVFSRPSVLFLRL